MKVLYILLTSIFSIVNFYCQETQKSLTIESYRSSELEKVKEGFFIFVPPRNTERKEKVFKYIDTELNEFTHKVTFGIKVFNTPDCFYENDSHIYFLFGYSNKLKQLFIYDKINNVTSLTPISKTGNYIRIKEMFFVDDFLYFSSGFDSRVSKLNIKTGEVTSIIDRNYKKDAYIIVDKETTKVSILIYENKDFEEIEVLNYDTNKTQSIAKIKIPNSENYKKIWIEDIKKVNEAHIFLGILKSKTTKKYTSYFIAKANGSELKFFNSSILDQEITELIENNKKFNTCNMKMIVTKSDIYLYGSVFHDVTKQIYAGGGKYKEVFNYRHYHYSFIQNLNLKDGDVRWSSVFKTSFIDYNRRGTFKSVIENNKTIEAKILNSKSSIQTIKLDSNGVVISKKDNIITNSPSLKSIDNNSFLFDNGAIINYDNSKNNNLGNKTVIILKKD